MVTRRRARGTPRRCLYRASFRAPRVIARSVDGDGEETPAAADGQFVALGQSAALVDALDALRAALLEKK